MDWLQYFGVLSDYDNLEKRVSTAGYVLHDNGYGTRHFQKWFTIYSAGKKYAIAQLCCLPFSVKTSDRQGIFLPGSATVQLCNRFCYSPDVVNVMAKLCDILCFKFKSISRLDLCYDFQHFDNKLKPETLILGYYSSKYWKMGNNKALGVGRQIRGYCPETLSFKGKNSAVGVKLYNKTKEMDEVHEKPYIRDAWANCGLQNGKDVWRLEISIKSDGRTVVDTGSGEIVKFSVQDIATPEQRMFLFFVFAQKYFHWRYNRGETRKARAKDVGLFNPGLDTECWKPLKVTASRDYSRKAKMLINALYEMIEDSDVPDDVLSDLKKTAWHLSQKYRLLPKLANTCLQAMDENPEAQPRINN